MTNNLIRTNQSYPAFLMQPESTFQWTKVDSLMGELFYIGGKIIIGRNRKE
jgi:hypothetical protein